MKHIEKIIINNARKLGENVEIDFGPGATIILAPNGTGKTTIFEVIELALTGQIKRLENSPDAIIQNGLGEMDVRLAFSEGKYCQAIYRKGGICDLSGDHGNLFAVENQSSLPYLLKLTHFLEQRSHEWFIDKNDKDAGDILNKLPLGKELQSILAKKQGLLTAIGKAEAAASDNLREAQKKISEFEGLIAQRNSHATKATLTPLNEIVADILSISKVIGYEEYKNELSLPQINSYYNKTKVYLKQETDKKADLNIKLTALKERIQLYSSNLELITVKQTSISNNTQNITELTPNIEQNKNDLKAAKDALSNLENEIKQIDSIKSMFEELEKKQNYLKVKTSEIEQKKKEFDKLRKSSEVIIEYLKRTESVRDQHQLFDNSINEKKILLNQIEIKRDFQKQWQNLSDLNKEIFKIKIPKLENKKNEYQESKSRMDNTVSEAETEYLKKKNNLELLNETSGAIQDAISIIRKNLAENQRACPVCQADYEPEELVKRIEKSLETLNPAIPHALKEEKDALVVLEEAKENQNKENQKLHDTISELDLEINKLKANQKTISESIQSQFPGLKNPEEAHLYIEDQILKITSELKELETKKNQLDQYKDDDEINNAKLKKSEEERSISDLATKIIQLQNETDIITQRISTIIESLANEQKENVLNNLSIKMIEKKEIMDNISTLEVLLVKNETELKECQDSCLLESETVSKIKSIQDSIIAEWEQAGLKEQPSQEILKLELEVVKKFIEELKKARTSSNNIEQKLANWQVAEKFEEINNEVKKQIGDVSEKTYIEFLKNSVDQKSAIMQNITDKAGAVNLLFENVRFESERINEELYAINEPWKGLLKRIVINPLIANAPLLSNKILRNKLTAKTSGVIHEKYIDIADIASEAQLTDLQLTLMLAMANRYRWTPWKALLLDDPTQHHDLVHASSVFDVLRDYIIEFDYQILMSTHDSIQAKFFQRKLDNEGVPSKIYQLVDRKGGVVAERIA